MARVLMVRALTAGNSRAEALSAMRRHRDEATGAGARYWAFEDADEPGSFTEFYEAGDRGVLTAAASTPAAAPGRAVACPRFLKEVEF